MPSQVNLKALGLNYSPNNIDLPSGSMVVANNVIIRRDNVVESRRGFKLYGTSFGTSSDRAKQLRAYRERIILHYSNKLAFDDGEGNFTDFSGNYEETQDGLRIKFAASNGNLYFTTSDGIKKISAKTATNLTADAGYITNAGGIKALDLSARLDVELGDQTSFFIQDSVVAYRVVWGIRDLNNNLILGTPSERAVIYNPLLGLMLRDFQNLLSRLDDLDQTGSMITDGNYVSTLGLEENSTASDLRTNLIALATKIDQDIVYADNTGTLTAAVPLEIEGAAISGTVCTIDFDVSAAVDGGNVGQYFTTGQAIYLSGFTPGTSGTLDGLQTLTAVDASNNTVSFSTSASGAVTVSASATVTSGTFRDITEPGVPSEPSTNAQLLAIQEYLESVIVALQNVTTESLIANDSGTGAALNIDAASCSGNGVTFTATFSTGDPRDYVQTGQQIFLSGFGNAAINGYRTISNVTSTTIQFASTFNGSATVAADAYINKTIVFNLALSASYIDDLAITTTASVSLTITVPEEVTTSHFFQVYRSSQRTATDTDVLADLSADDELQLIFEDFPTQAQIDAGELTIEDVTPDAFRGANLYTNEGTGEGILRANDVPPFAKDINLFKNSVFYANTKTRQRKQVKLLGVQDLINEYDAGRTPTVTLATLEDFHTYSFVTGLQEITQVTCAAGNTASLAGSYFTMNSANNTNKYYFWYQVDGAGSDPAVSGRTGVLISVLSTDTNAEVATKTRDKINIQLFDFVATSLSNVVTITNSDEGYADDPVETLPVGFTVTVTQNGRGQKVTQEISEINVIAGNLYASAGSADYFSISTPFEKQRYYVWFARGSSTDPAVAGKTGLRVDITGSETASDVAALIATKLENTTFFEVEQASGVLTVTTLDFGPTEATTENVTDAGFTVSTEEEGALQVLISQVTSVGQAVENTAKSFVNVVNLNKGEQVYAYYISAVDGVPGQMLFEGRDLSVDEFYFLASSEIVADNFDPIIAPTLSISSNSAATATVVTTSTNHGLANLDKVLITNSNSIPSIDGVHIVTVLSATTFSIAVNVTNAGSQGALIPLTSAEVSENEERPNRVYYSKTSQPEAVPLVNFFDIGSLENEILRIFPLRNSLFAFTDEGLYRISGEAEQFTLEQFDPSCILIAPDSVDVSNNLIFGFTRKGIDTVSEAGVETISRPIDTQILMVSSSGYTDFKTATWGVGYESDSSYLVFTVSNTLDETATNCYRYSTLTGTWTNYAKENNCGIVNPVDDKLYLGAGDENQLEIEKKSFTRLDYSDREFELNLTNTGYVGEAELQFSSVSDIEVGDVLTQDQFVSTYIFNALLRKIDTDPSVPSDDYFETLEASTGDSMRDKLEALASKLDSEMTESPTFVDLIATKTGAITAISVADPTVITSASHELQSGRVVNIASSNSIPVINGEHVVTVINANTFSIDENVTTAGTTGSWATQDDTFEDIKACYNAMIAAMNDSTNFAFSNYKPITNSMLFEAVVLEVNPVAKKVTLNIDIQFVVGPITLYKAIPCDVQYAPETMGDPLGWKHLMEATLMTENRAFTTLTMGFSTDLLPATAYVDFTSDGNGIFGHGTTTNGFGGGFFGGASNSAPLRTYIPRNYMRCRYINMSFEHRIAREKWAVYGITLTGNVGISTRAYRY